MYLQHNDKWGSFIPGMRTFTSARSDRDARYESAVRPSRQKGVLVRFGFALCRVKKGNKLFKETYTRSRARTNHNFTFTFAYGGLLPPKNPARARASPCAL